jgi:hypothetical protein
MIPDELKDENGYIVRKFKKYMMATKSWHPAFDWSEGNEPELCFVYNEDNENYYGNYIEGIGAFDVKFPKSHCRPLTEKEAIQYSSSDFCLAGHTYWRYTKEELLNSP